MVLILSKGAFFFGNKKAPNILSSGLSTAGLKGQSYSCLNGYSASAGLATFAAESGLLWPILASHMKSVRLAIVKFDTMIPFRSATRLVPLT